MNLDFLFFPGCKTPPKEVREGEMIWVRVDESHGEIDDLPLEEEMEDEDEVGVQGKLAEINDRSLVNTVSRELMSISSQNSNSEYLCKKEDTGMKFRIEELESTIEEDNSSLSDHLIGEEEGRVSNIQNNRCALNMLRK